MTHLNFLALIEKILIIYYIVSNHNTLESTIYDQKLRLHLQSRPYYDA